MISTARHALFAAASLVAVTLFAATPIVVASAASAVHDAKPPAIASNDAIADLGSMTVIATRPGARRM